MKITKYLFGLALLALGMSMTSCDQDNEGAIYNPANKNVSWELSKSETTTAEDEIVVPVMITRNIKDGELTVNYTAEASNPQVLSDDCNGRITFANGESVAFVNVKATNLQKGTTYTYTMTLDDAAIDADENLKANKTIEVVIISDYTWVEAGTCIFTDNIEIGEEGEVQMLKALESDNPLIFRIHEPFQTLYGDGDYAKYFTKDGDIEFTLTPNGDPISIKSGNTIESGGGAYMFYYDADNYPDYCYFEREGNHYYAQGLLVQNGSIKYTAPFEFIYDLP